MDTLSFCFCQLLGGMLRTEKPARFGLCAQDTHSLDGREGRWRDSLVNLVARMVETEEDAVGAQRRCLIQGGNRGKSSIHSVAIYCRKGAGEPQMLKTDMVCVCVCVAATEGFSGAVVFPLMADQEVFRLQETGTQNSPDPGWAAAVEASMPLGECKTQWLPTVNRQMEVERPAWPTHEHICRQRNQEDMVPPQGAPGLDGREMRWKDSQGNLCWGSTGWRL